jgi:integrase
MEKTNKNNLNTVLEALKTMFVSKEDLISLLDKKPKDDSLPPKIMKSEELKFTKREFEKMPKTFKKEFRTDGCTARVYKKRFSKYTYGYEIRYRRNGYNVYASGRNLEEAKQKFIEQLAVATKVEKKTKQPTVPTTFHSFTMYHFENFRKRKVTEKTYQNDLLRYKKYLQPRFEEKPLFKISSLECQEIIDEIVNAEKYKTAEEIFSLMSIIFKAAMAHGIINKNPLAIVYHEKHERKHGKSLTKKEENKLLEATAGTEYQLMFALALYTGMRPNEFETAKREGKFIVARNSKRKGGKIEYKKIPITPMLKPYMEGVEEISFYKAYTLREKIKEILPNHILYDLRTPFYSRCIECGVSDVAQKLFVGHSLGELGNAYTDVSDEYLLKEGNKLKY